MEVVESWTAAACEFAVDSLNDGPRLLAGWGCETQLRPRGMRFRVSPPLAATQKECISTSGVSIAKECLDENNEQ
jgi:hypothetical protein